MSSHDPDASPVNPLPPSVVILCLAIVGVEAIFSLAERGLIGDQFAVGWRIEALRDYGFSVQVFDWMLATRQFPPEHLLRFFTYSFVHGSLTHAAFAAVILLAMGKMVAETFGQLRMLALFLASGVAGALAYALLHGQGTLLFGAFPSVYGLIGGFTYILWTRLGNLGQNQYRAFVLIGFLMGIQLVFALLFGGDASWVGDVGGFVAGFLLSFVLAPGGWAALLARLRQER
ncbi:MAG: rhomboid family intramembrane serine protease [Rhodobacteraceae bacterium]|nr:MAG: rhomboid family intramembrane serine protease [Paracoccaceae bacterium]